MAEILLRNCWIQLYTIIFSLLTVLLIIFYYKIYNKNNKCAVFCKIFKKKINDGINKLVTNNDEFSIHRVYNITLKLNTKKGIGQNFILIYY